MVNNVWTTAWFSMITIMSSKKIWTLAVWVEERQEEEGVIPTCWIRGNQVMWPKGMNAIRAMRNLVEPGEKWLSFPLVKVKHQSNKKDECEEYDYTTAANVSDSESDSSVSTQGKRMPKKRLFSDFITDHDSIQNMEEADDVNDELQRSAKRPKSGLISCLPSVPKKVQPNSRHVGLVDLARDLASCMEVQSPMASTPVPSPSLSPPSSPDTSVTCSQKQKKQSHWQEESVRRSGASRESSGKGASTSRSQGSSRAPHLLNVDTDQRSAQPIASGSKQNGFPMSEARFQRRVLFLLTDIRNSLESIQKNAGSQQLENTVDRITISQAGSLDEFQALETKLEQESHQTFVVSSLQRSGGQTFKDNMKKGISRYMTNGLMAKMNMEGHGDKFGFKGTKLCSLLVDTITQTYKVTQDIVYKEIAKFLKNAPGRCGGGGRTQTVQPDCFH